MAKNDDHHHEEHMDESWLIPYADLLTLLLALFVVLFAMSSIDAKKFETMSQSFQSVFSGGTGVLEQPNTLPSDIKDDGSFATDIDIDKKKDDENKKREDQFKKETEELENLKKAIDGYIKENNLTTQLETKLTNEMLTLTIRDHALFSPGSANVKTESQKLAIYIADILAQHLGYEIVVAGHTDDKPMNTQEFKSNWELSSQRSLNFMELLLGSNKNIKPERFSSVGFGEYKPIADNKTDNGRSQNRRVEVSIIRTIQNGDDVVIP